MRALIIVSILLGALFLSPALGPFGVAAKVGSTFLLLLYVALSGAPRLLLGAIGFGVLGDLLLELPRLGTLGTTSLFLLGLCAFLIGHLFYIVLFLTHATKRIPLPRMLTNLLIVLLLVGVLALLWPHLGAMRVPVLLYSLALSAMGISAQYSRFPDLVALGALSFVVSDAMLAFTRFLEPFPNSNIYIWLTYYVAQLSITVGVIGFLQRVQRVARELVDQERKGGPHSTP